MLKTKMMMRKQNMKIKSIEMALEMGGLYVTSFALIIYQHSADVSLFYGFVQCFHFPTIGFTHIEAGINQFISIQNTSWLTPKGTTN